VPDSVQERIFIASWKIPPANSLMEKNVADDDDLFIEKMNTEASGTMPRYVENADRRTEQLGGSVFIKEEVCVKGFGFQFEPPPAKELAIAHHRYGFWVHRRLTLMAFDDCRAVNDVVKVAMRDDQEVYFIGGEGGIRLLRCVEKDAAVWRLVVKTIRIEHATGERFEPIHEKMVREKMIPQFDFPDSVCKLFRSYIR
jgi:hypothetical protein